MELTIIRVCDVMTTSPSAWIRMYVCICNGITDRQIRDAADAGCASLTELTMRTGVGGNCGSCLSSAEAILGEARGVRELPLPVLSRAA